MQSLSTTRHASGAILALLLALPHAMAGIVARFDVGDTTSTAVQDTFTTIGAAGTNPGAYAGPQNATSGIVNLRLVAGSNVSAAITKDGSGNFNSTANLVARNRGTPTADTGTYTYSRIHRDFVTGNAMGIQLSGLTPSANYAITFYAYDNSFSRTQTFTDITPGGTGLGGTVNYAAAASFTSSTSNSIYSTTINATSDSSGRVFFQETGTGTVSGSSNVAVLNGIIVDALSTAAFGFHHAYNGNFNDSSSSNNHGTATGAASITTDPAAIASGSGALALDGADGSYVTLQTPGAFSETDAWTATWWARRGETGTDKGMVMGLAASTTSFIWLNDNFTGLRFRSVTNATLDFTAPKDLELRHYALVANGTGTLTLYLDGQPTQTLSGNTSFGIDTIGKAYPTTTLHYNFKGSLDEVHVFNSALNATQVGELYNSEKPTVPVTRLRIVLIGGQSNADGRAVVADLPTSPVNLQNPQNDVSLFYKVEGGTAALTTLRPSLTETSQFGPEIVLGRKLADLHQADPHTRVAIIKYANGGTSLATHWKAGGDATTTGDGVDYVTFQQTVSQGLLGLAAAYPQATLELQSMVWLQGESDAVAGLAASYESNLNAFIGDVRTTYGSTLPFVIARLSSQQTNLNATYLNMVRAAQDAVAAADPRTGIFSTDSFGLKTDNLHFDAAGQQAIGRSFAEETAYYEWMTATFSAADINAGFAAPDADRDGDGQSNRAEFLSATDPLSSASSFNAEIDLSFSNTVVIRYASSGSRFYSVQQFVEAGNNWQNILSALQGTGGTVSRTLGSPTTRGIYRVHADLP